MNTQDTSKPEKSESPTEPEYRIALSRDDINALPMDRYKGPITFIKNEEQLLSACAALSDESVLGFDTETRPSFRKGESYPPSLIQLGGADQVYLFPLHAGGIAAPLKVLLSNADILKVGVALEYDIKELRALDDFEPGGFVGLEPMAKALKIKNQGLRGLAAALFGFRISKKAQCSNWSRLPYNDTQLVYAATDAWISRRIYLELDRRIQAEGLTVDLSPPPKKERRTRRRKPGNDTKIDQSA